MRAVYAPSNFVGKVGVALLVNRKSTWAYEFELADWLIHYFTDRYADTYTGESRRQSRLPACFPINRSSGRVIKPERFCLLM